MSKPRIRSSGVLASGDKEVRTDTVVINATETAKADRYEYKSGYSLRC